MDDSTQPPPIDQVIDLLEQSEWERARTCLEQIASAPAADRKTAMRSLRTVVEDHPTRVSPARSALVPFLEDDERPVRLSTAKLFVRLAESDPEAVVDVVPLLVDRLADDEEFYYVRARAAEALGYVALERPDAVDAPDVIAELRIGLSFDEPEVKEKLAKALAYVALGNPRRLRHQVPDLVGHLDDERDLVRYHLTTALVAIGCEYPTKMANAAEALEARLHDDESPYVRGRAAEALGLLVQAEPDSVPRSVADVPPVQDEPFVTDRLDFLRTALSGDEPLTPDGIGTREGVHETDDDVVEQIVAPSADSECPHCGLALPSSGPPTCPRCGSPF